jgi:hypothetical protein
MSFSTARGLAPSSRSRVWKVCRTSWNRTLRILARFTALLKTLVMFGPEGDLVPGQKSLLFLYGSRL